MLAPNLPEFLSGYPPDCWPLAPPEPLGNAGGFSGASLHRFPAGRGLLLARAWPPGGPSRSDLERIHAWQAEMAPLEFVPVPVRDLLGRTFRQVDDRFWQVEPWMPGEPERARPPAPSRLRAGMATIARVHLLFQGRAVDAESPGLAARLREVRAWLRGGFDALGGALDSAGPGPSRDTAARWLSLARRLAPAVEGELVRVAGAVVPIQPCLRDARPDHLLFVGDRVAGLVDFGAMGVESPAADLARLLSEWVGEDRERRAEALAAYEEVRKLDPGTLALIPSFDRSAALLIGGHWARWGLLEGRTFDQPGAVEAGLTRGLERLASLTTR